MRTKCSGHYIMGSMVCSAILFFTACSSGSGGNGRNTKPKLGKDKIYKGTLNVSVDESLSTIMEQETDVFTFLYDSVRLNVNYTNEKEAIDDFRQGHSTVLILARRLSGAEKDNFKNKDTIYTREIPIAYDAVALVANKTFDDSRLSLDDLKKYFASADGHSNSPALIFDNRQSSCVRTVLDSIGYTGKISSKVYALNSPQEVIDYVYQHANAIGFIPYSFLSDRDEGRVQAILKRIKILSLHVKNSGGEVWQVSANQSDIANGSYPLIRTITTITRFSYEDNLEWMFVNFLLKQKGAKVFLKAGLVPAQMPGREINVNTDPLNAEN